MLDMDQHDILPTMIRKHREKKGYTQEQLSQAIHKSDKYIGAVENGRISPPYPVLKEIIRILEIDANVLFYGDINLQFSRAADIYLRKMAPDIQKLAIDILRTMANQAQTRNNTKRE